MPAHRRLGFLLAVGLAAISSQSRAQDAGRENDSSSIDAPQQTGDIVVTAQRRSEKLRDVPLSVNAFSGRQLQDSGVNDTLALTTITPGLKMDKVGGFAIPAIRGITTAYTAPGGDLNVAVYLDGVYQASTNGNTFDLPDVDRIEVLKGPQGTLFGRNATGGAIQIFTRDPSYEITGELTAGYGNLNDKLVKGFVSAPLVDQRVALSLSGYVRDNDGYNTDLLTGGHATPLNSKVLRAKLRIDPADGVKIIFTGYYSRRSDASTAYGYALNGNTIGNLFPGSIIATQPYTVAASRKMIGYIKSYGFSGRLVADVGPGTLTATTGYSHNNVPQPADTDYGFNPNSTGIYYDTFGVDESVSQEVTYATNLQGPFNALIGAFFIDGFGAYVPLNVTTPAFSASIYGRQNYRAYAGFGEIYYNLTDRLKVIGGLRYSWEKRSLLNATTTIGAPQPPYRLIGEKSWSSVTPRASIKYEISPETNVYFTYSKGFKSGVFNTAAGALQANGSLPLANPEKVDAFELGFKGRLAAWLDVNAAVFRYNYKDVQVNAYTCVPVGSPTCLPLSILQNAASARITGLDLDATAKVSPSLDLRMGVSVLDAKYRQFTNAPSLMPKTDAQGRPTNTGNVSVPLDVSGYQMIRAPKFTITGTATYRHELAGGDFRLSGTVYHTSSFPFTFDGRVRQGAYTTLDGRVSWSPEGSGLTFSVYGRNLTDRQIILATFISESSDGISIGAPRTYGAEISYKF
jgi:iron complex outermembrane recepter protein